MDTFRKWWNKPKADDKSILARFYYADRALTAVASELDSFDGRAEPERCSRLVSRLRQGQDQVLSITNIIMDELLGEDRAPRAFRAKFPEEVLQESLAGQLWFGAECLAAGSSIMNREAESAAMRPLAKAVTKSLDHVRNLLREQCLRNRSPNSLTLNLDFNDAITETLCESLKIFDRLFAEFELLYVSAMVQVKTKQEHETQELITVLFSETLQRALRLGLLQQEQVDYFDPALMFSIPRLAIVAGLVIYNRGPLNMSQPAESLSEMFRPFRTLLIKIRDLLRTLNAEELHQLEQLLCTNEDIHIIKRQQLEMEKKGQQEQGIPVPVPAQPEKSINCDENDDDVDKFNASSSSSSSSTASTASTSDPELDRNVINSDYNNHNSDNLVVGTPNYLEFSPRHDEVVPPNVWTNVSPLSSSTTSPRQPSTSEDKPDESLVTPDCASGYLIPNTNFGNLLQATDAPLTDSFISSDDEYATKLDKTITNGERNDADIDDEDDDEGTSFAVNVGCEIQLPTDYNRDIELTAQTQSTGVIRRDQHGKRNRITQVAKEVDSGIGTAENTSIDHTPDSESSNTIVGTTITNNVDAHTSKYLPAQSPSSSDATLRVCEPEVIRTGSSCVYEPIAKSSTQPHQHQQGHSRYQRCEKRGCTKRHHQHHSGQSSNHSGCNGGSECYATNSTRSSQRRRSSRHATEHGTTEESTLTISTSSTSSTSSTNSDSESQEVTLALRTAGRMKFKSTENLLHRLFVCIAGVADQLQTNFASDLRQILRSVFLMNTTPAIEEDEIKIPEKSKDSPSDLFEFRASENDVIQENDGGSNQSIYSAEEVNPESDSVFEQSFNGNQTMPASVSDRQERSASLETEIRITTNRTNVERSRSLGEDSSSHHHRTQPVSVVVTTSNHQYVENKRSNSVRDRSQSNAKDIRTNRSGSNSPVDTSSTTTRDSPSHNAPPSPASTTTTTTIILTTNNRLHRLSVNDDSPTQSQQHLSTSVPRSQPMMMPPPRWIPDEEAPQCMSCAQSFTTFRRRHHCRNCGGVFCGVCSNSQAPLPKFGLNKAVRVCRTCFLFNANGTSATSASATT